MSRTRCGKTQRRKTLVRIARHSLEEKHTDCCRRWKSEKTEGFTCHSCFFDQLNGGLPKGYEGCMSLKEIAARKQALESQPMQTSIARGLTGQSWKSPKTSSPKSRSFSTLRAVWISLSEKTDIKDIATQVSQSQSSPMDDPGVVAARRQYQLAREAWKLAKDKDPQTLETSAANMHEARLRYRRVRHAWSMANDSEYTAKQQARNQLPASRELKQRHSQRPEVRVRSASQQRSRRANDPAYKLSDKIYGWVKKYPMARTMVKWISYRPILYSERVERHCQGCGYTRVAGFRLWWRSVSSMNMYKCHTCFVKSEDGGLPEAYSDCTSIRELRTRFKQLEGVKLKFEPDKPDIEVGQKSTKEA